MLSMVVANGVLPSVVPAVRPNSRDKGHLHHTYCCKIRPYGKYPPCPGKKMKTKIACSGPVGLCMALPVIGRKNSMLQYNRTQFASSVCAAAYNATCSASGNTQTIQSPSQTLQRAPVKEKERSPELDDGGSGFPPRDSGGGGGGGGGGGSGDMSGGFILFGILAVLGLLKDMETEKKNQDSR